LLACLLGTLDLPVDQLNFVRWVGFGGAVFNGQRQHFFFSTFSAAFFLDSFE
jgi:hypothetical protein